ncbi:MAG: AAA family ATPase [Leptospiraceae bacterium]|nr:AAA family ATPase [Leptospiraceae bacterium]
MIARRLKQAFRDSRYYEYLMSRFSTPDEIFGPVSIKSLQEDKYERKTDGYLPNANVMFLDAIFKSSPAIMNALLTVLNERLYHNGSTPVHVDVHGFIAASNELAQEDGLEAFSDRFITKLVVNPIEDEGNFFSMIDGSDTDKDAVDESLQLNVNVVQEIRENLENVKLSEDARQFITTLRKEIWLRISMLN